MRLAWVTDPHLDFLRPQDVERFCADVASGSPDALVITGDIANAWTVTKRLRQLEELLQRPIYFVLGNHDFYHGQSIETVRDEVAACARESPFLRWLTQEAPISLTAETALIGHDSWADGRYGDYLRSTVQMMDHVAINELFSPATRLEVMQSLAQEAADHFLRVLPEALASHRQVIVATHVPPFRDACWYEGEISNDAFLPHFSSRVVGEALVSVMRDHPGQLLVLCGHTHGEGAAQILRNVRVLTASARYSQPAVYRTLDLAHEWEWPDPPLYG